MAFKSYTSGLPTPTDPLSTIETLEGDVQRTIESLIELGVLVHDFQDESHSKEAVDTKIHSFVGDARQVAETALELADTSIPLDIISYIDAGRNPDVYSREFIELVQKQNQLLNGKAQGMKRFGRLLAEEMTAAFPDLAEHISQAAPPI